MILCKSDKKNNLKIIKNQLILKKMQKTSKKVKKGVDN